MKICPFCGSEEYIDIRKVNVYNYILCNLPMNPNLVRMKIYTCKNCGLGIYHDHLKEEELELIYKNYFYMFRYFDNPELEYFKDFDIPFIAKHINKFDSKIVELGCHDGFIMDMLQKYAVSHVLSETHGKKYINLMGIEPSPNALIGIQHGLHIEQKFFTNNYFLPTDKVDLFYSSHVFEHIKDPFSLFESMVSQLNDDGKIIIIVPNFSGYDITHYYYYSWPFFEIMAKKYGTKVIDAKISYSKVRHVEELKIVFSKIDAPYNEIKCPFDIEYTLQHEKEMQDKLVEEFLDEYHNIKIFVENKDKVYWYGTASYYLVSYCGLLAHMNVNYYIIPVDNVVERKNYIIPNCSSPVELLENLSNKTLDNMIICKSDKDFVLPLLDKYNIKVINMFFSKF